MKKTKSFNLEESAIDVILKYQKEHEIRSVSAALENILLVEMPKAKQSTDLDEIKELIKNIGVKDSVKNSIEETNVKEEKIIINSDIKNSMANTFDCMPD